MHFFIFFCKNNKLKISNVFSCTSIHTTGGITPKTNKWLRFTETVREQTGGSHTFLMGGKELKCLLGYS